MLANLSFKSIYCATNCFNNEVLIRNRNVVASDSDGNNNNSHSTSSLAQDMIKNRIN